MENRHPGRVEDYTTANLVLILANLFWIFGVIWQAWGIVPVVLTGLVLNHLITRLAAVREARDRANAPLPRGTPSDGAS